MVSLRAGFLALSPPQAQPEAEVGSGCDSASSHPGKKHVAEGKLLRSWPGRLPTLGCPLCRPRLAEKRSLRVALARGPLSHRIAGTTAPEGPLVLDLTPTQETHSSPAAAAPCYRACGRQAWPADLNIPCPAFSETVRAVAAHQLRLHGRTSCLPSQISPDLLIFPQSPLNPERGRKLPKATQRAAEPDRGLPRLSSVPFPLGHTHCPGEDGICHVTTHPRNSHLPSFPQ